MNSTNGFNQECHTWSGQDLATPGVSKPHHYTFCIQLTDPHTDKNENGKVIVPWPGTVLHYYAATEIVRWEDFDFVYQNPEDKYGSFGNGVTAVGFVPDQFPWVHRPTVSFPQTEKAEPSQTLTPSNVWHGMSQFFQLLGAWVF